LDTGDDPDCPAASRAGLDVEHPLEAPRPGHRCAAFGGRLLLPLIACFGFVALAALGGVTRTRSLGCGIKAVSRAMKSRGFADDVRGAFAIRCLELLCCGLRIA
jgi:hypothetical protein